MSVRAVLSSVSWMAGGVALCLVALIATGTLTVGSERADDAEVGDVEEVADQPASDDRTEVPVTESTTGRDVDIDRTPPPVTSAATDAFMATFDTPAGFYDEFDYGLSGQDPASNWNPDRLVTWTGDHDEDCGAPTSLRTIDIDRDTRDLEGGTVDDFDELFWWCREHVMTALNTVGYTIAWFSPKQYFSDISRVCWDLNVTEMSSRKWTQVLFVSEEDAMSHPTDRASGGFDLGFTNPIFRDTPGFPSTGILPRAGDLAGMQLQQRGYFGWFQDQDTWTTEAAGESQSIIGVTDKATRYRHCIEQLDADTIRFTQERPATHGGSQQVDVPGRIPQGPVRVVFQDDNYNGPKGELYDENANTWHWDNIVID
jgi:hypothetical protein